MANGIITVNTDAGWYPNEKIGSFAFWIKGDNLFLRGSGSFKDICSSSTDAETKSIANAIHILSKADLTGVRKIIFNRDNIHANPKHNGKEAQKKLHNQIQYLKSKYGKNGDGVVLEIEFRHVRAHTKTKDARSAVNRWCDEQCKMRLKERKELLKKTTFVKNNNDGTKSNDMG